LIMNLLLATYNYYPYNWGGTEVYVRGLVRHLQKQGFQATVLAAIPAAAMKDCEVLFEDQHLTIGLYEHENTPVIGCVLNPTTDEIYSRYNPAWKAAWTAFFKKFQLQNGNFDLLHLNANTPLVSSALAEAMKEVFPTIKTLYSYHVADTCPKGSLMYFDRETCTVQPQVQTCTACTLHTRLGMAEPMAKLAARLMPTWSISPTLPSILRLKYLTKKALGSFARLEKQVDKWHVFSPQIEVALRQFGVAQSRITVIRHGADEQYLQPSTVHLPIAIGTSTVFIFVGRFKKLKGLPTLLKAWMDLEEKDGRKLWIVGGGNDLEPGLASLLEKAKTRTDIEFLGTMEARELKEKMAQAHCIVIPTEWVETGPLVFHEAVAVGANVIASDIGGCAALAEYYGEGCQTFRMGDVADLQEKIKGFQYRPIRKKVMGQNEHYSLVIKEYEALLGQAAHASV
jgi:glycosyltransferase involved in cell wall biosynthesis